MADSVTPAPAPISAPAPKSTEDFHAAALAAMKSMPRDEEPSSPPPPVLDEKKLIVTDTEPAPEVEEKVEAKKEEAPKSDSIKRSFERMAAEKVALRQEKERLKAYEEAAKGTDPRTLQTLMQAIQSRDPVSLLAAAGFSHADYADAVVDGKRPMKQIEQPKEKSEVEILREELAQVRSRLQNEDISKGRQRTIAKLEEMAKADSKYEYVTSVEGGAQRALEVLEDYVSKNGPPLDENGRVDQNQLNDLYELSLQYVEEDFKAQAQKWEKVLTKRKGATTVPNEPPEMVRAASVQAPSRTLSNSLTSPGAPRPGSPTPKTDDDYIAAAAQVLRQRAQ